MLKFIAKLAVAGLLLWYVFNSLNTHEIIAHLAKCEPAYIVLSLLCIVIATYISSLRLGIYLGMKKKHGALPLYYSGMLFNTMLPGGISGDGYIAYHLKKSEGISYKRSIQILLLNRAHGLFFLNLLFYAVVLSSEYAKIEYVKLGVAVLFILQMPVYFIISRKFLGESWSLFLKTAPYSLGLQIFSILAGLCVFLALGVNSHLIEYISQFIAASIASILPITPGGVGVREFVFYKGSKIINIDAEFAVASSLLYFALYLLVSMAGIYFIFKLRRK